MHGNTDGMMQENISRMSTRHKGARDKDYAAMLKNPAMSPVKRMKTGEGDYRKLNKQTVSSKSKSGLGFADSDEDREGGASAAKRCTGE